ncbi:hypothetical protein SEVIR_9G198500v4 [Setaria viridis]|uniref:Bifunctional inhibitor/plant lipid transfer protein/seed storage helical domain-containing protein n=2 Tax=Setaria TaxID=4554 RepID=A0A368SIL5_SETIT|nr:non-specific lipid-transfer protein 2P-like [Setaria italica]XP_034570556.1 non-specific lipid-transfer protein 2P-like [Setaria viridis]RCV42221.1 hypothetical protein SETIT_9G199200v2 [Setaria italica]TKV93004.1 hypothetical protein SEVIR_9G198500v2 [Setaria viridis]
MAKAVAVLAALVLLVAAMGVADAAPAPAPAQQCDATRLADCAFAFLFGTTPLKSCCDSLREEQKGCLCVYARDPQYSGFLTTSTTVRNALAYCKVAYPSC